MPRKRSLDAMEDGESSQRSRRSSAREIHQSGDQNLPSEVHDPDLLLPVEPVRRIMTKVLPPVSRSHISKDAKEIVRECATEFIRVVTREASQKSKQEDRMTMNGDDLLWAMENLGFQNYADPLKSYLAKYREVEGTPRCADGSATNDGPATNDGVEQPGPCSQQTEDTVVQRPGTD